MEVQGRRTREKNFKDILGNKIIGKKKKWYFYINWIGVDDVEISSMLDMDKGQYFNIIDRPKI